jgi:hypothetical protein
MASRIISLAFKISFSEIVSGGAILKLFGCERNQNKINPFFKQCATTFATF